MGRTGSLRRWQRIRVPSRLSSLAGRPRIGRWQPCAPNRGGSLCHHGPMRLVVKIVGVVACILVAVGTAEVISAARNPTDANDAMALWGFIMSAAGLALAGVSFFVWHTGSRGKVTARAQNGGLAEAAGDNIDGGQLSDMTSSRENVQVSARAEGRKSIARSAGGSIRGRRRNR